MKRKIFKKNILRHYAEHPSYPPIVSAKTLVPDWYKKTERVWKDVNYEPNVLPVPLTFKACSVFGEAFTSGYMMPLPIDIAVAQTEGGPKITWHNPSAESRPLVLREVGGNGLLPAPHGMSNLHFTWTTKHFLNIPKGYSALLTHPLNRFDLPFITLSGIVDGEIDLHNGQIPVYFSNTFEGIIPAGTPIMQILLFKTEDWDSAEDKEVMDKALVNAARTSNAASGWYKKNIWKKKTYN